MLIAEDLLLLLTGPNGKPTVNVQRLAFALAGAVLVDLVIAGRVQVTAPGRWGGRSHIAVVNPQPLGDPLLDDALARILGRRHQVTAQAFVTRLSRGLLPEVRARLVARGVVREVRRRVLGIVPRRSWPLTDGAAQAQLHAALRDVVVVGRTPTDREACLVALLHALREVPHQLGGAGLSARELRARAAALSEGNAAADAVRRAITATEAAVAASVAASTAAATG